MNYNYLNSRGRASSNSTKGGQVYLRASEQMQEIMEKKVKAIEDAGNVVAGFATQTSTSDKGALLDQLQTMLKGFSVDEQRDILSHALVKIIINM